MNYKMIEYKKITKIKIKHNMKKSMVNQQKQLTYIKDKMDLTYQRVTR